MRERLDTAQGTIDRKHSIIYTIGNAIRNLLLITHISPQSTLRPQKDMKKAFSAGFATSAVNKPACMVQHVGNHQATLLKFIFYHRAR